MTAEPEPPSWPALLTLMVLGPDPERSIRGTIRAAGDEDGGQGWVVMGDEPVPVFTGRCTGDGGSAPPDPRRRFADAHLRRHILARTPVCIWPHCTRPARHSEIDHAHDHAKGGPTDHLNQWPLSADHHALKTRHGWTIQTTGPTPTP